MSAAWRGQAQDWRPFGQSLTRRHKSLATGNPRNYWFRIGRVTDRLVQHNEFPQGRTAARQMSQKAVIPVGEYQLDVSDRLLRGDAGQAPLSPLACRFLQTLAQKPGTTISRAELIAQLWSGNYLVGEPALNRLVSETRKAARSAGASKLVETVQKDGYRLIYSPLPQSDVSRPPQRADLRRWVLTLFAFIVVIVGLILLVDSLMGLLWMSRASD